MKRTNVVLLAFLIAVVAGWASAQDVPAKAGSGPALKAQPMKAEQTPYTYGTNHTSFYRMGAADFTGMNINSVDEWSDTYYANSTTYRRYGTVGSGWFIGSPHLPSGAMLISIRVNDCVNTDGSIYGDINSCNYWGDSCSVLAPIVTLQGCGYDFVDLSGSGYVVDNGPGGGQLVIRLATIASDGSDSFAGVTVEYQLQVSPAPGSPTFLDVAPGDFGYQHIEALAASGITGGCGGGNFCPNGTLTRAQMAVFLAKALGLHFQ